MGTIVETEGLTFDDVLLIPGFSSVMPNQVEIRSRFSKKIELKIPIVSSPMDTVTEWEMAVRMAELGGIGIIHRAMTAEKQAEHISRVKRRASVRYMREKPTCFRPDVTVGEVFKFKTDHELSYSSFPITDDNNRLLGIVTSSNFANSNNKQTLGEIMKPRQELTVVNEGTSPREAYAILKRIDKKVVPVVNQNDQVVGIYASKDLNEALAERITNQSYLDAKGRYQVGGAIGTGEEALERAKTLVNAGVDVLVIDTAHGHSKPVFDTLLKLKKTFLADIVVGNISTSDAARDLIHRGADGLRVGMGPGSICTTRVVTGVGRAQITALLECSTISLKEDVPIIADGGIRYPGDITKAIGAGASSVMLGNLLARANEAPGESVPSSDGRQYKKYRGMGSKEAMKASREAAARYLQNNEPAEKMVPEGVPGKVLSEGPLENILFQLTGGLRAGMGYTGSPTISNLQKWRRFDRITHAGKIESSPHDIYME